MSKIGILLLAGSILLGCQAQPRGSIEGKVIEATAQRPLRDAVVTLDSTSFTAIADSNGDFRLLGIPPGSYDLKCTLHVASRDYRSTCGYQDTVLHRVVVRADSTVILTIAMEATYDRVSLSYPITLPFGLPRWSFYVGEHENGGLPSEAVSKLIAVNGAKRRVLLYHQSLKGYVEIKTTQQALTFVRFFTDLKTQFLFKEPKAENMFLEVTPTDKRPSFAEMPLADWRRLGLARPTVSRVGDFFLVDRYVFAENHHLYRIQERVSPDGGYSIVKRQFITKEVSVPWPIYL